MNDEFVKIIKREDRLKYIGELPMGVIADVDRTMIIIPECCREGWESCPHVVKRPKPKRKNIGL